MSITLQPETALPIPPSVGLMTEVEFLEKHGGELGADLVRGRLERQSMPGGKHGRACLKLAMYVALFAEANALGRTCTNDTFVRIGQAALRGADVAFLSYAQWPAEIEFPDGPLPVTPELVGEVKSPSDSWTKIFYVGSELIIHDLLPGFSVPVGSLFR